MRLKTGLNLTKNYSFNFDVRKRRKKNIKFIIVHYTGMKKEIEAIKKLRNRKSKVSSHYLIKNNGEILRLVPDRYVAWHAGQSNWKKLKSLNKYSIGIEIQNTGHDNNCENFSKNQITSTKKLLKYLIREYKINPKNVLGHSDIAPDRKKDPGEKFPWKELSRFKVSQWHNLDEKILVRKRLILLNFAEESSFFKNLAKIGYLKISQKNHNSKKFSLTKAFQRHFRQKLINGIPDQECLIISKNLLKS